MTPPGMLLCSVWATPMWLSGLSHLLRRELRHGPLPSNDKRSTYAASVLQRCQLGPPTALRVDTHGVRTMMAPRARSMTSFSRLILAGSVMMHLANELRLDTRHTRRREEYGSGSPHDALVSLDCATQCESDPCVPAYRVSAFRLFATIQSAHALVGSITTLFPGTSLPVFSASSTMR
jgi:hypothetical protein